MKKREQGILTVEASIVLTLMTLFVLFLFSFIRVYRAENVVSHATLQAADAMALESYLRENALDDKADDVVHLANRLTGVSTLNAADFESLRSANVPTIAKTKFVAAVSDSETTADTILTGYGVKDGLAGIDFSASTVDLDRDDVIVNVSYTLKLQFPIFGATEIDVTKSAKAKTFGEILFEIIAEPENPIMGSTSGSGNYQHGTTVQITANPNYGYKFLKWSDGNTDNPRTVSVTEAHKYIAVFGPDSFGVNVVINPAGTGTASGAGTYNYLTTANLAATPNPGYHFEKWSVYKHKDSTTTFVTDSSISQTVDQSYTFTANFAPNTYTIKVEYQCSGGTPNVNVYEKGNHSNGGKSIQVLYGKKIDLTASSVLHFAFKGWKEKGGNSYVSTSANCSLPVPPRDVTYVAYYESTLRTVNFYDYNNSLYASRQVYAGNSLGGSMPGNPYWEGYRFNGWNGFGSGTVVYNNMSVYGNWSKCTNHVWGNCGVVHGLGGTYLWKKTNDHKTEGHYVSWASCIRCIYCKQLDSYRVLCGTHWEKWGTVGWGKKSAYVGENPCGVYNLPTPKKNRP